MSPDQLKAAAERCRKKMKEAAKQLEFLKAEEYRKEMVRLEDMLSGMKPQQG